MKKVSLIFAIFYLLNVVGYGVEVHYCLGQIADVNYALLDTSCACDTGHNNSFESNCCDEESFFIQLETDHNTVNSTKVKAQLSEVLVQSSLELDENTALDQLPTSTQRRGPPKTVDRVTIYHTYIFYG